MASFFGYIGGMNITPSRAGMLNFGHAAQREMWRSVACMYQLWAQPGEYNRYCKDHQKPISIDVVPVSIPPAVRAAEFTTYKHTPLTGNGDEIRLLELLPALFTKSRDFVACRLVVRRLCEDPQYEALSYTWGRWHGMSLSLWCRVHCLKDLLFRSHSQ